MLDFDCLDVYSSEYNDGLIHGGVAPVNQMILLEWNHVQRWIFINQWISCFVFTPKPSLLKGVYSKKNRKNRKKSKNRVICPDAKFSVKPKVDFFFGIFFHSKKFDEKKVTLTNEGKVTPKVTLSRRFCNSWTLDGQMRSIFLHKIRFLPSTNCLS